MSFFNMTLVMLTVSTELEAKTAPPTDDVRQSVQRGLTFLEKGGIAWQEKRKYAGCHHVPMMLWSHHEARRKGLSVNPKVLDEVEPRALRP
jgi:hypothetical protein